MKDAEENRANMEAQIKEEEKRADKSSKQLDRDLDAWSREKKQKQKVIDDRKKDADKAAEVAKDQSENALAGEEELDACAMAKARFTLMKASADQASVALQQASLDLQ